MIPLLKILSHYSSFLSHYFSFYPTIWVYFSFLSHYHGKIPLFKYYNIIPLPLFSSLPIVDACASGVWSCLVRFILLVVFGLIMKLFTYIGGGMLYFQMWSRRRGAFFYCKPLTLFWTLSAPGERSCSAVTPMACSARAGVSSGVKVTSIMISANNEFKVVIPTWKLFNNVSVLLFFFHILSFNSFL